MAKKLDCSELAQTIFKIAMHHASTPGVGTIDQVTDLMKRSVPEIDRAQVVSSIVEVAEAKSRQVTDLQKQLFRVKQEARNDKRLTSAITDLEGAIAKNEAPAKPAKRDTTRPDAIQALMSRRDALKERAKQTEGSIAERVRKEQNSNERHIQRKIDAVQKLIDEGKASAERKAKEGPRTERVAELTAKLNDVKEKLAKSHAAQQKQHTQERASEEARLQNRVDQLQGLIDENKVPERAPSTQGPKGETVTALRDQIEGLKTRLSESNAAVQKRHQKANAKRVKSLQQSIERIEGAIAAGTTIPKKGAGQGAHIEAVQQLVDKRDAALEALRNSPAAIREKYEVPIAEMTRRLLENNFTPPASREEAPNTPEVNRLMMERDRLSTQINRRIDQLRPKSWAQKYVAGPLGVARNIKTGYDISAPGRQGNFVLMSNPLLAGGNFIPMVRAMFNEQFAYDVNREIMQDERTPLLVRSGLFLSDQESGINQQEEGLMTRLQEIAEKIPLVAGSQRAYTTFLNKTRFDYANLLMDTLPINGEPTLDEARDIANFVNNATGRGGLAGAEKAAEVLNNTFFAPRYVASRFNLLFGPLTMFRNFSSSPRVRRVVAKEYMKYAVGSMAAQALMGLAVIGAGGSLMYDPRSADFMRGRFGNTTVDPTGGVAQAAVLAARLMTGQTVGRGGEVRNIRTSESAFGQDDTADYATRFARGKLAPGPALALDLAAGKNVVGEPVGVMDAPKQLIWPMSVSETIELLREQGIPVGIGFAALSASGFSTQTFEPEKKKK